MPTPCKFRLLSWNVLAQQHLNTTLSSAFNYYSECIPSTLTWEHRQRRQHEILCEFNTDILCLQEIHRKTFHEDFGAYLNDQLDFDYLVQSPPKTRNGHEIFVSTAWNRQIFKATGLEDHRSRTLLTALEHITSGKLIIICNVHLDGHPSKEALRFNQVKSTMKSICKMRRKLISSYSNRTEDDIFTFMCGDFNSGPSDCIYKLMLEGKLSKESTYSYYDDIALESKTIQVTSSDYSLPISFSPYSTEIQPTFMVKGLRSEALDFIWTSGALESSSRVYPASVEEIKELMLNFLPSLKWPSDHLPIISDFSFLDHTQ